MAQKKESQYRPNVWIIVLILVGLFVISSAVACSIAVFNSAEKATGNIAIIQIKGAIASSPSGSFFSENYASADTIIKDIARAESDPKIKGVIFEINSPGGSAVASEEILSAVKEMQKPKIAWIREVGASGAYWIASSTDHIIASRMSVTGSVGVISSYLEFSGIMDDYNITYQRLVSGKYKDTGTPFRQLKSEEYKILQEKLDMIHRYFLNDVQEKRNISSSGISKVSTGMFFLGSEALELGLIDQIGGKKEAIEYMEKKLGITVQVITYEHKKSFIEQIFSLEKASYAFGKGFSSNLFKDEFLIIT